MKLVAAGLLFAATGYALQAQTAQQTGTPGAILTKLVGEWREPGGAVLRGVPVAGGKGVQTTFTLDGYEAVTLWGYDASARLVRALEVNSVGKAMLYAGEVESPEELTVLRYSATDPSQLRERLTITWQEPQIVSEIVYYKNGEPTEPQILILKKSGL